MIAANTLCLHIQEQHQLLPQPMTRAAQVIELPGALQQAASFFLRPLAIHRHANPRAKPGQEIHPPIHPLCRCRQRVKETRLLVNRALNAAQGRIKEAEKTVGKVGADRFRAKDRRQIAAQADARKLDFQAAHTGSGKAIAAQDDAQPQITPAAAADQPIPFPLQQPVDRQVGLPAFIVQRHDLAVTPLCLCRKGGDLQRTPRRH